MKKLFSSLLSLLGPMGTCAALMATMAVASFPVRGLVRSISRAFTPEVIEESGSSAVMRKFEAKFQYKPLIVLDSDIIVRPRKDEGEVLSDGTKLPTRKQASLELEYRGYAEYVVDLDISEEDVMTNGEGKVVSVQIALPRCPCESVRWQNSSASDCWSRIEGTDSQWVSWYQRHMGQFVTASIHSRANTDANLQIAKEQTRLMVNAMVGTLAADPLKGVDVIWKSE